MAFIHNKPKLSIKDYVAKMKREGRKVDDDDDDEDYHKKNYVGGGRGTLISKEAE